MAGAKDTNKKRRVRGIWVKEMKEFKTKRDSYKDERYRKDIKKKKTVARRWEQIRRSQSGDLRDLRLPLKIYNNLKSGAISIEEIDFSKYAIPKYDERTIQTLESKRHLEYAKVGGKEFGVEYNTEYLPTEDFSEEGYQEVDIGGIPIALKVVNGTIPTPTHPIRSFLDLSGQGIERVSEIDNLDKIAFLGTLDLSNNDISGLSGIEALKNLHTLYLDGNDIANFADLGDLSSLKKLKSLYLENNRIEKIEGLSELTSLIELNLSNNKITQISGLESLVSLQKLDLSRNRITKIEGLARSQNLYILDLSRNKIVEITGLEGLNNLLELNLSKNSVKLLSGIETAKNLKYLHLDGNAEIVIEEYEPLKKLEMLHIRETNVDKKTIDEMENLFRNLGSKINFEY